MIEILHGDCREFHDLVDGFDVMIADPPYRAYVHDNATSQSASGGTRERSLGFGCLTRDLRSSIAGFSARVRKWSVIYSDVESTNVWRHACQAARLAVGGKGEAYIRPVPWIRWSMPQLTGDRPTTGHEMLTCYWGKEKGRKSWNGPGNLIALRHEEEDAPPVDELTHKSLRGAVKHKCEKPLDQALDLVDWFSDVGDVVWDPTMGRGTTALACAILDRNFVGCEIDAREADLAQKRVDAFQRGGIAALSPSDAERHARFIAARSVRLAAKGAGDSALAAKNARKAQLAEINARAAIS